MHSIWPVKEKVSCNWFLPGKLTHHNIISQDYKLRQIVCSALLIKLCPCYHCSHMQYCKTIWVYTKTLYARCKIYNEFIILHISGCVWLVGCKPRSPTLLCPCSPGTKRITSTSPWWKRTATWGIIETCGKGNTLYVCLKFYSYYACCKQIYAHWFK